MVSLAERKQVSHHRPASIGVVPVIHPAERINPLLHVPRKSESSRCWRFCEQEAQLTALLHARYRKSSKALEVQPLHIACSHVGLGEERVEGEPASSLPCRILPNPQESFAAQTEALSCYRCHSQEHVRSITQKSRGRRSFLPPTCQKRSSLCLSGPLSTQVGVHHCRPRLAGPKQVETSALPSCFRFQLEARQTVPHAESPQLLPSGFPAPVPVCGGRNHDARLKLALARRFNSNH